MEDISASVHSLKSNYREVFKTSCNEILEIIESIKPDDVEDLFKNYPLNSTGKLWQSEVLKLLDQNLKTIYTQWIEILEYKNKFACKKCGACCKLACSEFSVQELKTKAQNGDNFAQQFLSVFVPYETKEEAMQIYPEYIKLLEQKNEKVYYYHCPKVTEQNMCPDYENRPQICKDFPDNPLALLPKFCGYVKWKEEVELKALKLHSKIQIIEYYKDNINASISRPDTKRD